ncbi:hypothetical protein KY333_03110 [Candidatus Woesearchaeota archaeon]|nr:hypothetical protein [Candidatus Woesearchaeota archaeon]
MIENLIKALSKNHRSKKTIKTIKEGLFIPRSKINNVADILANHLRSIDRAVSTKELKEQLSAVLENKHGPHYFEYSNTSNKNDILINVGYLVLMQYQKGYEEIFPKNKFKRIPGKVICCSNYVHPKDPLFGNKSIIMHPDDENIAIFKIRGKEIYISYHGFKNFTVRICKNNPHKLKKKYNVYLKALRDRIMTLYNQLEQAVPVTRKNHVLQIIKHGERAEYYTCRGIIYVLENGNVFKTCYEKDDLNKAGYKKKK